MTISRFWVMALFAIALVGCGLSDQQRADYATVRSASVSPAIYDKMVHGDPLSIGDIISLSRGGVSDAVIIRYIRDHDTVYYLSSSDFARMQRAGVSRSVVDFMAQTGRPGSRGPDIPVSIGIGVGVGGGGYWH